MEETRGHENFVIELSALMCFTQGTISSRSPGNKIDTKTDTGAHTHTDREKEKSFVSIISRLSLVKKKNKRVLVMF